MNKAVSMGPPQKTLFTDYDLRSNVKKAEMRVKNMENPNQLIERMLTKIIKFWQENAKWVKGNDGCFRESELPRI